MNTLRFIPAHMHSSLAISDSSANVQPNLESLSHQNRGQGRGVKERNFGVEPSIANQQRIQSFYQMELGLKPASFITVS